MLPPFSAVVIEGDFRRIANKFGELRPMSQAVADRCGPENRKEDTEEDDRESAPFLAR